MEKNQGKKVATFFGRNKRAPIAQEEDEGDGDAAVPPDAPEDAPGDALTRLPADASSAVKKKGEEKGKVIDIADKVWEDPRRRSTSSVLMPAHPSLSLRWTSLDVR